MASRSPTTIAVQDAIDQINCADVRALFNYDPATGHLVRKIRSGPTGNPGERAGSLRSSGYRSVRVKGKLCIEHRVIWLWWHGEWPSGQIDHINGTRDDNRLSNLRLATASENQRNSGARKDNRLGIKGVCRCKGRYRALIRSGGKQLHLGYYATPEEAAEAYRRASTELHGEFSRS